ncbi:MAG: hypothetical protein ACLQQ4_10040 [Bacteroidia bacterium]
MKKVFAIVGITVVLFSCKKNQETFTATNMTGTTQVTGNITKPQAVAGGGTVNVPASGVTVTVEIQNAALYPYTVPPAQGSKTYSGVTDVSGNFNITVTTLGGKGCPGSVYIGNLTNSIYDPTTGATGTFTGGSYGTLTCISGVPVTPVNFNMTYQQTGTNVTGTATVMGTLKVVLIRELPANNYYDTTVAVTAYPMQLYFYNDPTTLTEKTYNATTDGNGDFTFSITTAAESTIFPDNATITIPDYTATQDTIKPNGNRVTGRQGYYSGFSTNFTGLIPGAINNSHTNNNSPITYRTFNPN